MTENTEQKKLKIFVLHGSQWLTDHHPNGDGLVAWGFVSELARQGHSVHVATDKLDVKAATVENLTLVEFPRRHRSKALHYLSYMRRVRSYFDELAAREGVDVVHQMNPVVRGLSLALLFKRVPILLGTYVGDWVDAPNSPRYKPSTLRGRSVVFLKKLIDAVQQHFATTLILATPHAMGRVALRHAVENRIEYLHHGVDIDVYRPAPAPEAVAKRSVRPMILYVGSLHSHKGVETLFEAFTQGRAQGLDAELVFVGEGWSKEKLIERTAQLGLQGEIRFAGRATRQEVADWMRECDVLCAPSFGEPYGQNILEAMSSGKAVILTNAGGHRFLGAEEGTIKITPGDVEALLDALLRVTSDRHATQKLGEHNRRFAVANHSWQTVTKQLVSIYERSIERYRG